MSGPKKILWHCIAPWVPTGYGAQTDRFTSRFARAGHDVAISSWYGLSGTSINWNGIEVLPADAGAFGAGFVKPYYAKHDADLVIALGDAWAFEASAFEGLNSAVWVPIDHYPCPPMVAEFFRASGARPVAMSKFGQDALQQAGLDALYVPHGIDSAIFTPHTKAEARAALGVPESAFLVGMVANNQGFGFSRKAFPEAFEAVGEFRRRHPDTVMYLHAEMTGKRNITSGPGIDLKDLADLFDVPVLYTPPLPMEMGWPEEAMALVYSAFDVLLSPSYGEGFGVPIVEAQACGTPVIVTDWTAMPELCGAGWTVEGMRWLEPNTAVRQAGNAYFKIPFVGAIVEALESAYERRGDETLSAQAREFALQYDADRVMETYWTPVLEDLTRPREVPPLLPKLASGERGALIKQRKKAKR